MTCYGIGLYESYCSFVINPIFSNCEATATDVRWNFADRSSTLYPDLNNESNSDLSCSVHGKCDLGGLPISIFFWIRSASVCFFLVPDCLFDNSSANP